MVYVNVKINRYILIFYSILNFLTKKLHFSQFVFPLPPQLFRNPPQSHHSLQYRFEFDGFLLFECEAVWRVVRVCEECRGLVFVGESCVWCSVFVNKVMDSAF